MSQRRGNRNKSNISDAEDDPSLLDAINHCVRYIVYREGSKIPIKRTELLKYLTTSFQTPANQVNTVIVEANKILKKVYGYKLVQVEAKSGIQYIVVLNEECDSMMSNIVDTNHRRLLIAALLHIFMSGSPVKDDDMWKFLIETGLMEENDHAAKKLLTHNFTRQLYLQYTKMGEGDLARHVFEWNQRATEEVPKLFLLKKMGEAFDEHPNHWSEQYKDAISEDAES